jgi:23S rRNA G2445 N2-methylase RlmL
VSRVRGTEPLRSINAPLCGGAGIAVEHAVRRKPFQERVRAIDDDKLDQILELGAERAEAIAKMTLGRAKTNMGLIGARSGN